MMCSEIAIASPHSRLGVTLVEVIFSIGVVLIGLLGLLSVLPLAGHRAQDSISLNVGSALSDSILRELESQRFLSARRLLPIPAAAGTSTALDIDNPAAPAPVPFASFCIDPEFASTTSPPATASTNGYEASFFPYYKQTHNPLRDPMLSGSPAWPEFQPRMLRVAISQNPAASPPVAVAFGPANVVSLEHARRLVESKDDLPLQRPDDRTKPGFLSGLQGVWNGLPYGARVPTGEFTWIATVNPLPDNMYASVTVVVMRKRERSFQTPLPPPPPIPPTDPEKNALGERLAYVTYAAGFSGGAGGIVHLVASDRTISKIRSNDWVMLSRTADTDATATGVAGTQSSMDDVAFHHWYRVAAVTGDAEIFVANGTPTTADSNLNCYLPTGSAGQTVWRHKVLLDGPDWSFGFDTMPGYADEIIATTTPPRFDRNTYATIVRDVVSVSESTVLLRDL